ncbi:MAG: hypothetical protein ACFNJN_09180, partial [Capnocytophaga ochracea]
MNKNQEEDILGDNHIATSAVTPLRADAFQMSETEKIAEIETHVRALAKYAVDNNNNLLVTGYADSATGSAKHNQWLSEERA